MIRGSIRALINLCIQLIIHILTFCSYIGESSPARSLRSKLGDFTHGCCVIAITRRV